MLPLLLVAASCHKYAQARAPFGNAECAGIRESLQAIL